MDCDNIPYSDDIEAMDTQTDPVYNEGENGVRGDKNYDFIFPLFLRH